MSLTSRRRVAVACILGTAIVLPAAWSLRPAATSGHANARATAPAGRPALPLPAPADAKHHDKAPAAEVPAVHEIIGAQWQASAQQPQLAAFSGWTARYLSAATPADRDALLADGIATATARRDVLATMIRENPEQALAAAVPVMVRKQLPAEIVALLEERVSGRGSVEVLAATPGPGQTTVPAPYTRHAVVNDREYTAFAYGRREKLNYLPDISIAGIALDGSLALSDSPLRVLEAGEQPDGRTVEEVCEVSGITTPVVPGAPLNATSVTAVEVNGGIQVVCEPSHVSKLEKRLISGEGTLLANGAAGSSEVTGRPDLTWTHGTKKVLIIRVDFSDVTGTPKNNFTNLQITPDVAVNTFNDADGVKDFYEDTSFGKTTLSVAPVISGTSADVTPVLRMPSTASSYVTVGEDGVGNAGLLHTDAQALATGAGYNVANYDRIGVVYSYLGSLAGSKMTFGGLGSTPGKNFWINGSYVFSVVAHEIGHNYGLNHSSSWEVTDGNPVSPAGTKEEYGDTTDVMGNGNGIANHFNHWNKSIAQWLPDAAVTTIQSAGTFRVYRFDHPSANLANPLALKVTRNRTQDYWIGYRRATSQANYNNGAYIVWGGNQNSNSLLLDMNTPGDTMGDAPLAVGQTFTDTAAGITLTTVARGGSGISEYLDVQVGFQPRIAWTQSAYSVDEQAGTATLTLSRSNNATGAVSVNWATAPGTATTPADFTTSSGTISWANGDAADKTITVPIIADATLEGTHDFTVTLSSPSGGVIVDSPTTTVSIVESGSNDTSFAAVFINSSVMKTIPLPDGKLLIGGYFTQVDNDARVGIARLNANGTVDATYPLGGVGAGGAILDMARQPDGKVLVIGNFTTLMGAARNRIARLNADGTLDATFNPAGPNDGLNAMVLQPDGKILIGGYFTSYNGTARECLARLNADGSLDGTFTGPDFAPAAGWGNVSSLALQPDGKALVGGAFYFSGSPFKAGFCRVTTTGALDPAFNGVTNGAHLAGSTGDLRRVTTISVQLDGKILIGGDFTAYNNTPRGGFARLTSTGALDTGFTASSNGYCNAILTQPDGEIVVGGGFTSFAGSPAANLVRISSSGVVDAAFSAPGGPTQAVNALAMQADGKIVFGSDYASFQGKSGPLYRIFAGLPGLPGTLQFGTSSYAITEGGAGSVIVSVTRSGGSSGAFSVNYATVPGTAGAADFTASSGTLTWANGETAAKTITIPIVTDALVEGTETFTMNLGQPLLGGAILGSTQSTTVSISDPIVVSAYQTWRESKFTAPELANDTISGDNADPDADGIVNLLEFAFNLQPKTSSQTGIPTAALQNIGGSNYLTLTFRRRLAAPELTYTPQTNELLAGTWTGDTVIVGAPVANGDGTETVTYRSITPVTGLTRDFIRLQVLLDE